MRVFRNSVSINNELMFIMKNHRLALCIQFSVKHNFWFSALRVIRKLVHLNKMNSKVKIATS